MATLLGDLILRIRGDGAEGQQTLDGVSSGLSGIISPANIATGAVMGVGAAFGTAGSRVSPWNESIDRAAIVTGESADELRDMAEAVTGVEFPLDQVTAGMDELISRGITTREEMEEILPVIGDFSAATGKDATESVALFEDVLSALGIPMEDAAEHMDQFTRISEQTDIPLGTLQRNMGRVSDELVDLDLGLDGASAGIEIFRDRGYTGQEAVREFRREVADSGGDMEQLLENLGVTAEEFAEYEDSVAAAEGITGELADRNRDTYNILDEGRQRIDEFLLSNGNLIEGVGDLGIVMVAAAPLARGLISGIGSMIPVVAGIIPALGGYAAALWAAMAPKLLIIGVIAALVAAIILLWRNWDTVTEFLQTAWQAVLDFLSSSIDWLVDFLSSAWEWIRETAVEAWQSIRDFVVDTVGGFVGDVIEFISGLVSDVVGFFSELASTVWETVSEWVSNLWESISVFVSDIIEIVSGFVSDVIEFFSELASSVWETVSGWVADLWESISAFVSNVVEAVSGFVSDIIEFFSELASTVWETVSGWVSDLWESISGFVSDVIESISGFVSDVIGFYTDLANEVWDIVSGWVSDLWESISGFVSDVVEAVSGFVSDVIGFFSDLASDTWETISGWIDDIIEGVSGLVSDVVGFISDLASDVIDGISGMVSDTWEAVSGWVSDVVGAMQDLVRDAVAEIRKLPGRLLSALGDAGRLLRQWGRDLIDGLIGGITSMLPSLDISLGGITDRLPFSPAKTGPLRSVTLDPESVLGSLGEDLMGGLLSGLDSQENALEGRLGTISDLVGGVGGSGDTGSAGSGSAGAGDGGTSINVEVSSGAVRVSGNGDDDLGRRIGEGVAQVIEEIASSGHRSRPGANSNLPGAR